MTIAEVITRREVPLPLSDQFVSCFNPLTTAKKVLAALNGAAIVMVAKEISAAPMPPSSESVV